MPGEENIPSIDKFFNYPMSKFIIPYLHNLNITPNNITIFNICLRIYIFYKMYNGCNTFCLKLMLLSHFLDCLDGALARKYNMVSKLGATIDHVSDKIFWSSIFVIAIFKCKNNYKERNIIVLIGSFLCISLYKCLKNDDCELQNTLDMNAMILVIIIFYYYNTCIN